MCKEVLRKGEFSTGEIKYILKEETIDKGLNILNENIFEGRKYFARRHLKGRIICLKIILQGGNNNEEINILEEKYYNG